MVSIDDVHGLFKEPITGPIKSKMAEIRHLENKHAVIFFCRGWSDLDKILETGAEWHVDCGDVWKCKPDVEFEYGGSLGEFNGMSSQSHVSHCRVLPLGEFTVMIPEPHATLQGAVTWQNQSCHIAGCKSSIRHIENRFRHILLQIWGTFLLGARYWVGRVQDASISLYNYIPCTVY